MITKEEFNLLYIPIEEEVKLMRDYDYLKTPILKYSYQKKVLIHIGTNHSMDKKDNQFKVILKEIKKENPDCVIFECTPDEIEILKTETKEEQERYHGEIGIIYNFLKDNIIKIGADINVLKLADKLDKEVFTLDEINAYKIFVMIGSEMKIYKKNIGDAVKKSCEYTKISMNPKILKIINDYVLEFNKKKINKLTIKDDLSICPLIANNQLSKIAREISILRDYNMINTIFSAIEKHQKIILLTGINHLIRHKKIFEKYLGRSKKITF